jgi:hypothetical protein
MNDAQKDVIRGIITTLQEMIDVPIAEQTTPGPVKPPVAETPTPETGTSAPITDTTPVDYMVVCPTNVYLENQCPTTGVAPDNPQSPYLWQSEIAKLEAAAKDAGVRLIVTHGNATDGTYEGAHMGHAVDILYGDMTPEQIGKLALAFMVQFPNIQKSTLTGTALTKERILSAAIQESDDIPYNHDVHFHFEMRDDPTRLLMHSIIRNKVLAWARMNP